MENWRSFITCNRKNKWQNSIINTQSVGRNISNQNLDYLKSIFHPRKLNLILDALLFFFKQFTFTEDGWFCHSEQRNKQLFSVQLLIKVKATFLNIQFSIEVMDCIMWNGIELTGKSLLLQKNCSMNPTSGKL